MRSGEVAIPALYAAPASSKAFMNQTPQAPVETG